MLKSLLNTIGNYAEMFSNFDFTNLSMDVVNFNLGKRPYGEKPMSDVMHEVCILNQHLDVPRNCPLELSDQLGQCWSYYPKDRPSFRDLLHIIKSYLNPYESDSGSGS